MRIKINDPKPYGAKGAGSLENRENGARGGDEENPILPPAKDLNKLYGISPSDIDK